MVSVDEKNLDFFLDFKIDSNNPSLNVFTKKINILYHSYSTGVLTKSFDFFNPIWNLFGIFLFFYFF
jgi:hypothetical protein